MNKHLFCSLAAGATLLAAVSCETYDRTHAPPPPPPEYRASPPSPADIKAMVKAGISDEVIMSQIRNTHAAYRLTTAEILDLKDNGVSEKLIDFMINTPSLYQQAPPRR